MTLRHGWPSNPFKKELVLKNNSNSGFYFCFTLLLTSILLLFHTHTVMADESRNTIINEKKQQLSQRKIIAYYFHGTRRCRTCKKFEALTKTVLQNNFQTELDKGILEWHAVNIDEKENKHFIKEFNLYTKAIVLVEISDKEQSNWKNLEQIWQFIHNEDQFKKYILSETKMFIKGK